jgi:hypothetical protein
MTNKDRGTAERGVGVSEPSLLENVRQQAVLGAILGVRTGLAFLNPLGPQAVKQDEQDAVRLQRQGSYERAFEVATGFQEYFDIKRQGESIGASREEQAAVMLGQATGFNQAVETIKGEDRSAKELKGIERFSRGIDAASRLTSTVASVASGVKSTSNQVRLGLPFSAERAMNLAVAADKQNLASVKLPPARLQEARGTANRLKGTSPLVRGQPAAPKASPVKRATLPSWTLPEYASENSFMGAMRRRLLNQRRAGKPSLLDFLLALDGDWQKGQFTSKSGRLMRGRYALAAPDKQLVQAGHLEAKTYAKAAGKPREFLMLEDADLNWLSGQSVEAQGAYSSKGAVLIDGYPVDIRTARLYESHGLLPAGTVAAAPMIEPPPLF